MISGYVRLECFKQHTYEIFLFSFDCQSWVHQIRVQHVVLHRASMGFGVVATRSMYKRQQCYHACFSFAIMLWATSIRFVVGAFMRDNASRLVIWSVTAHHTVLCSAAVGKSFFASKEILFVLVPDTPVSSKYLQHRPRFSAGKGIPPASSRWCCLRGASWGDAMVPLLLRHAWKTQPLLLSHEMVPRTSFWLSKHNGLVAGVISCGKPLDNNTTEEKRMIPHLSSRCLPALPHSLGQDASPPSCGDGRDGEGKVSGSCRPAAFRARAAGTVAVTASAVTSGVAGCSGFTVFLWFYQHPSQRLSFRGAAFLVVTSSCANS